MSSIMYQNRVKAEDTNFSYFFMDVLNSIVMSNNNHYKLCSRVAEIAIRKTSGSTIEK